MEGLGREGQQQKFDRMHDPKSPCKYSLYIGPKEVTI